MIDLKQLSQFDIKSLLKPETFQVDINFTQLQGILLKRKDILINIALVIVTLWGVNTILKNKTAETDRLKTEIEELAEKADAIIDYEKQKKINSAFDANTPKGFEGFTDLINKVSVLANSANVQILSFNPEEAERTDSFVREKVRFSIFAENYQNMLSFVQGIETAEEGLRIDYWSSLETGNDRGSKKGEGSKNYMLSLSSIKLNNEN